MTTLYIIGNGFDLQHGLPTRYSDFYKFETEALDALTHWVFPSGSGNQLWCSFEDDLGTFDTDGFYAAHDHTDFHSESFKPSEAFCLEDELTQVSEDLVGGIQEQFQEWIREIDIAAVPRQIVLEPDARYLSFNYTSTLETVYGVAADKVLHIHGSSVSWDELIFGHGQSREEEPELDEDGESNRTMFSDANGRFDGILRGCYCKQFASRQ